MYRITGHDTFVARVGQQALLKTVTKVRKLIDRKERYGWLKLLPTILQLQLTLIVSNSVDSNFRLSRICIEAPNFVVYKYI